VFIYICLAIKDPSSCLRRTNIELGLKPSVAFCAQSRRLSIKALDTRTLRKLLLVAFPLPPSPSLNLVSEDMRALVVLVLFVVSVALVVGGANGSQERRRYLQCPSRPLPNIEYLAYSFDLLLGEPADYAARRPVLQLPCTGARSMFVGNDTFAVPDNVDVLSSPSSQYSTTVQVYVSSEQLEQELASSMSVGVGGWFVGGMFRLSAHAREFQRQAVEDSRFTAYTQLQVQSWRAFFSNRSMALDPEFALDLFSLPAVHERATCTLFRNFFDKYGTHHLSEAVFGGLVTMDTSFAKSVLNQRGASRVTSELSAQFGLLTRAAGLLSSDQSYELSQYNQVYRSNLNLVGGNPALYQASQWPEWATTIPSNPVPLKYLMVPLSHLLPEGDARRGPLDEAIRGYLQPPPRAAWISVAALPRSVWRAGVAVVGDAILVAGGQYGGNQAIASVLSYRARTNSWATEPSLPQARVSGALAAVGNTLVFMGGEVPLLLRQETKATVYLKRASDREWTTGAALPVATKAMSAVSINDTIYMFGGVRDGVISAACLSFDLRAWHNVAPMRMPRSSSCAVVYNHTAFVFGGWNGESAVATVEMFDPIANAWQALSPMPTARSGCSAAVLGESIYVFGGQASTYLDTVEIYHPSTDSWTSSATPMPDPRSFFIGGAWDNTMYLFGGDAPRSFPNTGFSYSPPAEPWCSV